MPRRTPNSSRMALLAALVAAGEAPAGPAADPGMRLSAGLAVPWVLGRAQVNGSASLGAEVLRGPHWLDLRHSWSLVPLEYHASGEASFEIAYGHALGGSGWRLGAGYCRYEDYDKGGLALLLRREWTYAGLDARAMLAEESEAGLRFTVRTGNLW